MPIYDFKCRQCGNEFEQVVKEGQRPSCPSCGADDVERFFPFSAGVSTTRTRERARAVARARAQAVKKEKDLAHQEYLRKHIEDHS
jgi:putative FmdB family regulatory protein